MRRVVGVVVMTGLSSQEMLEQLKGMDVGFLSSVSSLISSCR